MLSVSLKWRVSPALELDVAIEMATERVVLFGRSGAGKTSLLRLIAGLDRPDRGWVRLDGVTLCDTESKVRTPLWQRSIGMIFQDDLLFPHLSVRRNVEYGLRAWDRGQRLARVEEVARLCGVEGLLQRMPTALSGGERQRVGLARAIAPRPRLLLCDEPVSALDTDARFALIQQLKRVQREERIPLLVVTHAQAEAVSLGGRLLLMEQGRIVADGDPLTVLTARERGSSPMDGLRNVVEGVVAAGDETSGSTRIQLDGGPALLVPYIQVARGQRVTFGIRADDILLARSLDSELSARNRLAGCVDRVLVHGSQAEVLVRTGEVVWLVSLVASTVPLLDLRAGSDVLLVIKARSCHLMNGV